MGEAMNESWNLDRKPTAAEKATGVIGALLLSAASGVCLWFSVTFLKSIWASVFSSAFAIFSAFMLYRFIFTGGRKLGRPEITKLARVLAVAGIAMVIGSFFADGLQSRLLLLSLGLFGIGGGALNLSKRKEEPIQQPEPMRAKGPHGSS